MGARLFLASEVQDTLRHLPPATKKALRGALKELKDGWPGSGGLHVAPLDTKAKQGPAFRVRVGNWRIVFRARSDRLEGIRLFHRREGYGWLDRL
jgi:mRNA-degrading endonuclease RelE of RelBE toxin-antitoxin system